MKQRHVFQFTSLICQFFYISFFFISETLMYLNLNKDTEESRVVSGLLDSNALVSLFFYQNVSTVRRLCKLSKFSSSQEQFKQFQPNEVN